MTSAIFVESRLEGAVFPGDPDPGDLHHGRRRPGRRLPRQGRHGHLHARRLRGAADAWTYAEHHPRQPEGRGFPRRHDGCIRHGTGRRKGAKFGPTKKLALGDDPDSKVAEGWRRRTTGPGPGSRWCRPCRRTARDPARIRARHAPRRSHRPPARSPPALSGSGGQSRPWSARRPTASGTAARAGRRRAGPAPGGTDSAPSSGCT